MILEIGCGLTTRSDAVTIDKSPHSRAAIIRDVARRGIPFADNTFEVVEAYEVLEHIEAYEDFVFLLNEIWRVLVPGGVFKFSVPDALQGIKHMTHHRVFTEQSFQYLLPDRGAEIEYMRKSDGIEARFTLRLSGDGMSIFGEGEAVK